MKKILIILFIVSISSCRRDVVTPPYNVLIHYVNQNNNDIFSITNDGKNGYWMDSVRLYDYYNGVKTLFYDPSKDQPYRYGWLNYYGLDITLGSNEDVNNNYTNTLIQLKANVVDTLKIQLSKNSVNSAISSVWYNGVLHKEWPVLITK